MNHIVTRAATDVIGSVAAFDCVVARAALDPIVLRAASDPVIALAARDAFDTRCLDHLCPDALFEYDLERRQRRIGVVIRRLGQNPRQIVGAVGVLDRCLQHVAGRNRHAIEHAPLLGARIGPDRRADGQRHTEIRVGEIQHQVRLDGAQVHNIRAGPAEDDRTARPDHEPVTPPASEHDVAPFTRG